MSEWKNHSGFDDPKIPGDTWVEVLCRDGATGIGVVHDWDHNWQWQDSEDGWEADGAIIAYRLAEFE